MDFLEKLDCLMKQNNLNKSTLSKACDIPYTTIDNWYKRGYEGLKLTTLRKLSEYFGVSLDYWVKDNIPNNKWLRTGDGQMFIDEDSTKKKEFFEIFDSLTPELKDYLLSTGKELLSTQNKLLKTKESE